MRELHINEELRRCLPALTEEERGQLEANILADGCLDAIIVWSGRDIIVDGHNRYPICRKHGILFRVEEMDFPDLDAAIIWALKHQKGRRNATEEQKSYLRGQQYEREKKRQGRPEKQEIDSCLSATGNETAERIAKEHGVTEKTIRNDAAFARDVDTIATKAGDEAKAQILSGKVTKKEVREMATKAQQQTKEQLQAEIDKTLKGDGKKGRRARSESRRSAFQRRMAAADPAVPGEDGHIVASMIVDWRRLTAAGKERFLDHIGAKLI